MYRVSILEIHPYDLAEFEFYGSNLLTIQIAMIFLNQWAPSSIRLLRAVKVTKE